MRDEGAQYIARLTKSLNFGDHISVLQIQEEGLQDHPKHWADDMPMPSDPPFVSSYDMKMLEAEQENVQTAVTSLSKIPVGTKLLHTDIFTTLGMAGQYAKDFKGQPITLILLSDMLQSTKTVEMDHARHMPTANWISQQKTEGLLPDFTGGCVLVVGADGVTPAGLKVRNFWESYFAATGASLPGANYRTRPPMGTASTCGKP